MGDFRVQTGVLIPDPQPSVDSGNQTAFSGVVKAMSMLSRALLLIGLVALLAACSGAESDGVVTFTDDERLSRFEIPESWHVYELSELSELEDMPFDEQVQSFSFPAISSV